MRSSLVVTLALTVSPSLLGGCNMFGIRANPRVEKIVREDSNSRDTTKLDYDDDGRLVEVEDEFEILELLWDDGALAYFTREDKEDGDRDKAKLEYENGKLVEVSTDVGGTDDDVTTIDYDKSGRIEKVERESGNGSAVSTTLYGRDNSGRVVELTERFVYEYDDALERSESKTDIEYKAGRIVQLSQRDDLSDFTINVEYEDDRLTSFHIESVYEDEEGVEQLSEGDIYYEYDDDGLIVAARAEANGETEVDFEISYGEGEAKDLDVTPTSSFFFLPFFDLRGASFSNLNDTQAARLAGVSW